MEDNTVDCPRCGEVFSLEFTRCPKCGLNLYPEDEEDAGGDGSHPEAAGEQPAVAGEALWGLILGCILAGAVSFMLHMLASQAEGAAGLPPAWQAALFLSGPLGALVGGAATGSMAGRGRAAAAGLGALVGVATAALGVLLETRWRLVTLPVILEAPMLLQYALCILLGALGGWLKGRSDAVFHAGGLPASAPEVKGMSWEDLMYRDLLTRVRFNRTTAERLVEYERRLAPDADRYTLLKNAVDRLDRDRRR